MSTLPGAKPANTAPATAQYYQNLVATNGDLTTVTDVEGRYLYVSPVCARLFGRKSKALEGRAQDDFVHPDDIAALRAYRAEVSEGGQSTLTCRFLCGDGSYRWTETTADQLGTGPSALVVSTVRDIEARHLSLVDLSRKATTDPLTGLVNRTVLMDRLQQGLRRMDRGSRTLTVLFLDLDRFKVLNDSLGHLTGDAVLLQMAERLSHHLRPADTLARLGGDEFVIVAEDVSDIQAAVELGERIIQAGHEAFLVGEEQFTCTLSVGVAFTDESTRRAEDLLQEADLALYRAKDRGRDRAELFDEELRTRAVGRLATERLLRRAIEEDRLVVEYQPIIDLRTGHTVGAEALVRIREDADELLQPALFLGVAEEVGLLIRMDEQVLLDAVTQAAGWQSRLNDTEFAEVAINVSARHLADAGFANGLIALLAATGLPRRSLQIEVTEQVLMEASNSAMTGLRAIRDAGVQVGLDDFGTGYSSLAYLRQFPLDFVKIDRSFVQHLGLVDSDRAIVAAVIELSHALGLTVVAEGVETERQLRVLDELGCDRVQGFLFGASSDPAAIDEVVLAGPVPAIRILHEHTL